MMMAQLIMINPHHSNVLGCIRINPKIPIAMIGQERFDSIFEPFTLNEEVDDFIELPWF
jgi:hypothetical protein